MLAGVTESLVGGKIFGLLGRGECGFGLVNIHGVIIGDWTADTSSFVVGKKSEVPSDGPVEDCCWSVFPGRLKSRGTAVLPRTVVWEEGGITADWSVIPCLFALCVRRKYLLQIHLLQMSQRTRIWFGDLRATVPVEPLDRTRLGARPDAAKCTGFHLVVGTPVAAAVTVVGLITIPGAPAGGCAAGGWGGACMVGGAWKSPGGDDSRPNGGGNSSGAFEAVAMIGRSKPLPPRPTSFTVGRKKKTYSLFLQHSPLHMATRHPINGSTLPLSV